MSWEDFGSELLCGSGFAANGAAPFGEPQWGTAACAPLGAVVLAIGVVLIGTAQNLAPGILRAGRCSARKGGRTSTTRPSANLGESIRQKKETREARSRRRHVARRICKKMCAGPLESEDLRRTFWWRATLPGICCSLGPPSHCRSISGAAPPPAGVGRDRGGRPRSATASREVGTADGVSLGPWRW